MKNKVLWYFLGVIIVLSAWFINSYVNADVSQCKNYCSIQYGTDPWVYDCYSQCESAEEKWWSECKWIKLNTNFPIIWNCIWDNEDVTKTFPSMIWALTKVVMSLILVVCFILIIVAWIMWAGDNPWQWKWWWAKWLLAKVAITILLLWFSWVILKLINPNFFNS